MGEVMVSPPHLDKRIDGDGAVGQDEQGVHVEFLDCGPRLAAAKAATASIALMTAMLVARLAAEAFDQFPHLRGFQRAVDFGARGGQQQGDAVLQQLGEDAAGADDQREAELRIGLQPDDEFGHGAGHHALDQNIRRQLGHALRGGLDLFGGAEVERHAAGFGLVGDGSGRDLEVTGKPSFSAALAASPALQTRAFGHAQAVRS